MIGLMSALEEELVRLKEKLEGVEVLTHAGIEFFRGRLANREVVLLRCGVGKVNAAVATQILIDHFKVTSVMFSGLAGALVPHLKRGDVVVANYVVQHDVDLTAFGRRHGQIDDHLRMIETDPKLVHAVADACERVLADTAVPRQMVVGTVATGDSFVSDPDRIRWLQREFGAVATEMEGGAVGQVCLMNRIPFAVLRIISDSSGGGAAGEFIMFLDEASDLSSRIVAAFLEGTAAPAGTR